MFNKDNLVQAIFGEGKNAENKSGDDAKHEVSTGSMSIDLDDPMLAGLSKEQIVDHMMGKLPGLPKSIREDIRKDMTRWVTEKMEKIIEKRKKEEAAKLASVDEALEIVRSVAAVKNHVQVGDQVVRDPKFSKYSMPDEDKNQAAIVTQVFDEPRFDKDDDLVTGAVLTVLSKDTFVETLVDLRYFIKK